MSSELHKLWKWYFEPGEKHFGRGFFVNPYGKFCTAKMRHIFAFDSNANLFVGQSSVYPHHFETEMKLNDIQESGWIHPISKAIPIYSQEEYESLGISDPPKPNINETRPVLLFEKIENRNIRRLNQRLRLMSQRFYDYGLPESTVFVSKQVDLWMPSIKNILKGAYLKKPETEDIVKLLEL